MAVTASNKGKAKALPEETVSDAEQHANSTSSSSSSDSSDDSDASESESDDEVTQEYLNSLLEKAKEAARTRKESASVPQDDVEAEVIKLDDDEDSTPLPRLDPGVLPPSYLIPDESNPAGPSKLRDPEIAQLERSAPAVPPELKPSHKLSKKERKVLKNKTAGPGWFDLPAPAEADLPRLYREVEALRLRNQLDPKRFYKKEEGEGKGVKGLPKHFAIGTILPTNTPFGTASADNLSRVQRKRTLVDELVDDAEAKSYAKKKFKELQTVRGARGRGTLAQRQALRKPKW